MTGVEEFRTDIEAVEKRLRLVNVNELSLREFDELTVGVRRCLSAINAYLSVAERVQRASQAFEA